MKSIYLHILIDHLFSVYWYLYFFSSLSRVFCVHFGLQATKSDVSSEGEWFFTSTNEKPIARRLDFDCESQSATDNAGKSLCPGETFEKMTKNTYNENEGKIDKEINSKARTSTPMVS
jgi:hypothetical protein